MRYLSVAELLNVWANVFGEETIPGVRDFGLLEAAVEKPRTSFGGQEFYKDAVEKGVVLCEALIKNHPFVDGNKRTGVVAMLLFLDLNGYDVSEVPDDLLYNIAMGFAEGQLEREQAVSELRRFLKTAKKYT